MTVLRRRRYLERAAGFVVNGDDGTSNSAPPGLDGSRRQLGVVGTTKELATTRRLSVGDVLASSRSLVTGALCEGLDERGSGLTRHDVAGIAAVRDIRPNAAARG